MPATALPRNRPAFSAARFCTLAIACGLPGLAGCAAFLRPSNDRVWAPELERLATADFQGPRVTVHNIRNCHYRTEEDFTVNWYDRAFDLRELNSVDYIVVPFSRLPAGAHTFVSFGFAGRDYLAVSIETRREKGENYIPLRGITNRFEIVYVVGDERDLIGLRTNIRHDDVYVYRLRCSPQQAQAMFVDVMDRCNKLAHEPEFYHTITNNCMTNVVDHYNHVSQTKVPYNWQILLPGFSDRLAYNMGLIDSDASFEQTRERARVNEQAYLYRDRDDFSVMIRR